MVAVVANYRGLTSFVWLPYALFLPPIALLHALISPPTAAAEARAMRTRGRAPCPHCAEFIRPAASVCPHCHSALDRGWAAPTDKPGGRRQVAPDIEAPGQEQRRREARLGKINPNDRFTDPRKR